VNQRAEQHTGETGGGPGVDAQLYQWQVQGKAKRHDQPQQQDEKDDRDKRLAKRGLHVGQGG
jgi:hypothetical protein